jgi:GNAT superfamily N-acetyltransferase
MIEILQIDGTFASDLCQKITKDLPQYFGLPEANVRYIEGVKAKMNFAAKINDEYLGLISLDFPYANNINIYWMAVFLGYHGKGIGSELINTAIKFAIDNSYKTITVETLAPSESDENYLKTYRFYESSGFKPLFNLKPHGYEWNMVYMARTIEPLISSNLNIRIKMLTASDVALITESFKPFYTKHTSTYEEYLREQKNKERMIWLAFVDNEFAGYVTLKWNSHYKTFRDKNIPEIMDLNVLPPFRGQGIASRLMSIAETEAGKKSDTIGIGCGLYSDYDSAQKLYIKRGYIPDGKGVTYNYEEVEPGNNVILDDDLVLWFTKKLDK